MKTITRRDALAAGPALAVISCVGAEPAPLIEDDAATIEAWIADHRGALPTAYDDLARLPSTYRNAIAEQLSPAQKSALVQEHLRRALAARPGMTTEQLAVIALAREAWTPAWYAATPEERQAWGDRWGQRLDAIDAGEFVRIFGSIGPEDEAIRHRVALALRPPGSTSTVTYDDFKYLPRRDQVGLFDMVSPGEAAGIIRGHLAFVAAHPRVTAQDRAVLAELEDLVSPAWYAPQPRWTAGMDEGEAGRRVAGLDGRTRRAVRMLGAE